MLNNISRLPERATNLTPRNGSNVPNISRPITGTEFAELCRQQLGKDAGCQLQILTGYPRSTCYRYAAGSIPPLDFIAKLCATDAGEPFFIWFMQRNHAQWWRERERHRRMGETIDKVR
jgi:hypothetical protein